MIEYKIKPETTKELRHTDVYINDTYVGYIIKGSKYDTVPYYFVAKDMRLFNTKGTIVELKDYLYRAYIEISYNDANQSEVIYVVYNNCYFGYINPDKPLLDDRYIEMFVLADSPIRGAIYRTYNGYNKLIGNTTNKLYLDDIRPAMVQDFDDYRQLCHISFDETINKDMYNKFIKKIG